MKTIAGVPMPNEVAMVVEAAVAKLASPANIADDLRVIFTRLYALGYVDAVEASPAERRAFLRAVP